MGWWCVALSKGGRQAYMMAQLYGYTDSIASLTVDEANCSE